MNDDAHVLAELEKMTRDPDPYEELSSWARGMPAPWKGMSPGRALIVLRSHLHVTQGETAGRGGLTQSQVSRLEGDEDALLSTWRRVYSALGFEVLLVPKPLGSWDELERRAEGMRPPLRRYQERVRSRRLKPARDRS